MKDHISVGDARELVTPENWRTVEAVLKFLLEGLELKPIEEMSIETARAESALIVRLSGLAFVCGERADEDSEIDREEWAERWLERGGEGCPDCGGDITGGQVDIDGVYATQDISCLDCDGRWVAIYRLCDIKIDYSA